MYARQTTVALKVALIINILLLCHAANCAMISVSYTTQRGYKKVRGFFSKRMFIHERNVRVWVRGIAVPFVTVAAMLVGLIPPIPAGAAGETISGGSNITGDTDAYVPVTGITVSGAGSNVVPISLSVDRGQLSMTTTTGLTFSTNQTGSKLEFEGTVTDVNNALATLRYKTTRAETVMFVAQLSDPGEVFFPGNGHLYEVVSSPNITADDAATAAAARTKYGATGYLATITSQAENDFVAPRLDHDGWFGARDSNVEGDWEWAFGPEAGTVFYRGNGNEGGAPVNGLYSNWASGEPNDSGDEDCAQFYASGNGWNDLSCSGSTLDYYVVEYGAPGDLPAVPHTSFTITTVYPTPVDVPIASCSDLLDVATNQNDHRYDHLKLTSDIDCTGQTLNPLFNDYDSDFGDLNFRGVFDGQGHAISGLEIDGGNGSEIGLIAIAENATVKNLTLSGEVTGSDCVGSVAGRAIDSTFDTISSSVDITGDVQVGGIVGCMYDDRGDSTVTNSTYSGNLDATYGTNGGIVGSAEMDFGHTLTLDGNTFSGTITPHNGNDIGGIAGYIDIEDKPSVVSIKNNTIGTINAPHSYYVGGLTGYLYSDSGSSTIIKNNHLTGSITGNGTVGGMIGYADAESNGTTIAISNTTMDQDITALTYGYAGGIVGESYLYGNSDTKLSITNTTVSGNITGDYYTGGLIAYATADNGEEEHTSVGNTVSGDISGNNSTIGGLYGSVYNPRITGSTVTGDITSNGNAQVGGAIGYGGKITMDKSSATGNVSGVDGSVGGLVGYVDSDSQISESFATGDVVGGQYTGGLAGSLLGTVTDTYARGSVDGSDQSGGLIGYCEGTIQKSYATGVVSNNSSNVGGLVGGENDCAAEDSFWDIESSMQPTSLFGTGKTTEQMKIKATFTDTANSTGLTDAWNFNSTWNMVLTANDGYPCLTWTGGACTAVDDDEDGIPTAVENAAPNGGDANNDGIPDSTQGNVASFINTVNNKYVAVALDSACSLTAATTQSESSQAAQDAGFVYDNGLIHFTANCGTPGYSTSVKVYQYGVSVAGLVLRKYNPTTHAYFTVPSATLAQQTIGGQTVAVATYAVTDGGALDTDGVANGIIVDPVGLAAGVVSVPNTGLGGRRL